MSLGVLSSLSSRDSMKFDQFCDWLLKENAMQRRLDRKDKDSSDFLASYAYQSRYEKGYKGKQDSEFKQNYNKRRSKTVTIPQTLNPTINHPL